MWLKIADLIIRFRALLMALILVITAIMGWYAVRVEMSYDLNRTVPPEDPDMVYLNRFRQNFGEDGNIIAVGLQDSSVFSLEQFRNFERFCAGVKNIDGVKDVLSLPEVRVL